MRFFYAFYTLVFNHDSSQFHLLKTFTPPFLSNADHIGSIQHMHSDSPSFPPKIMCTSCRLPEQNQIYTFLFLQANLHCARQIPSRERILDIPLRDLTFAQLGLIDPRPKRDLAIEVEKPHLPAAELSSPGNAAPPPGENTPSPDLPNLDSPAVTESEEAADLPDDYFFPGSLASDAALFGKPKQRSQPNPNIWTNAPGFGSGL